MPKLHFIREGRGPVVVLAHALGLDLGMWDEVAPLLARYFTVLRYDQRGHGRSEAPPGPYTLEALAGDAAALVDSEVGQPVHFVGASMGGILAQQLAASHPQLVRSIVVAQATAWYSPAARRGWRERIEAVQAGGMRATSDTTVQRWFTPAFHQVERHRPRIAALRTVLEATDPAAYIATCQAAAATDLRESNRRVACPALVIAGTYDASTPLVMSESVATSISGAQLMTLQGAHLAAVERPAEFAALVTQFLQSQ